MAHYDLQNLVKLWERDDITTEQAIGQILLLLRTFNQRLLKLEATRTGRGESARRKP